MSFVPEKGQPPPGHTFHSTAVVNSTLGLQFNGICKIACPATNNLLLWAGTQIHVFGLLPPGDDLVSADYSIDSGPPVSKALDALVNESLPLGNSSYFVSPKLPMGPHNITVKVTNTGVGRNYTLDFFDVRSPNQEEVAAQTKRSSTNVGAIVAGILAAFVLGIVLAFAVQWIRRHARSSRRGAGKGEEKAELRINSETGGSIDHDHDYES